jgi:hypothetical protein
VLSPNVSSKLYPLTHAHQNQDDPMILHPTSHNPPPRTRFTNTSQKQKAKARSLITLPKCAPIKPKPTSEQPTTNPPQKPPQSTQTHA